MDKGKIIIEFNEKTLAEAVSLQQSQIQNSVIKICETNENSNINRIIKIDDDGGSSNDNTNSLHILEAINNSNDNQSLLLHTTDSNSNQNYLQTPTSSIGIQNNHLKIIPDDEENDMLQKIDDGYCQESSQDQQQEHFQQNEAATQQTQIVGILTPNDTGSNFTTETHYQQYEIYENGTSNVYSFEITEQQPGIDEQTGIQIIEYNHHDPTENHLQSHILAQATSTNDEIINLDDESEESDELEANLEPEVKLEESNYQEQSDVIEIDEDSTEIYQCVLCPKTYKDNQKLVSHVICKHTPVTHKRCECCDEEPRTLSVSNHEIPKTRKRKSTSNLEYQQPHSSTYRIINNVPDVKEEFEIFEHQQPPSQIQQSTILNYETIQNYNLENTQIECIENFAGNQIFQPALSSLVDMSQVIHQPISVIPQTINIIPRTINVVETQLQEIQQQEIQQHEIQQLEIPLQPQQQQPTTIFKCIHCSKFFTKKSELLRHSRKNHDKQRPYSCNVCGKLFLENSEFRAHELSHIKEVIIL